MSTIHFQQTTTATAEEYIAALTDFGPGRSKVFGNSADADLKVHSESPSHADVTEGSGGVWERLVTTGRLPIGSSRRRPTPIHGAPTPATATCSHVLS
jgi:hypothetical protein